MTPAYLSEFWKTIAPGLGNHLWQSTLFAAAAGLFTFILRKQPARTRYWLWLAASLKFLVPFSLLISLGKNLAWSRGSAGASAGMYVMIEQVSQPFQQSTAPAILQSASAVALSSLIHFIPMFLIAAWLCGLAVVLVLWCVRWRRVSAAMGDAVPLREGREVDTLRQLERIAGSRRPIEIVSSQASLEPGIFGIAHPVLIWPEGITVHLEQAHLEAILAHELWHVRRRDNLAAAMHMVVEAVFWFHPLVWWLGARLVEERERACDEEVLDLGSERQVYAESILKVCEFCMGSPLACVSGVTGSDLKRRMVYIMTEHMTRKLDFGRKLLLTAVGFIALAAPIVFGIGTATQGRAQAQSDDASAIPPQFEVSIKPSQVTTPAYAGNRERMVRMMFSPDGFQTANTSLKAIIQEAYGVQANQIAGPTEWLSSAAYDINLKTEQPATSDLTPEQSMARKRLLLQAVLADRFKLKVHHESKELPVYLLTVAESGSKLQPSRSEGSAVDFKGPDGKPMPQRHMMMQQDSGQVAGIGAQGVDLSDIVRQLSMQLGVNVIDKTGLAGSYDFNLHWTKDAAPGNGSSEAAGASASSIFSALQEQVGLKLDLAKAPMDVLVIDHIEEPQQF